MRASGIATSLQGEITARRPDTDGEQRRSGVLVLWNGGVDVQLLLLFLVGAKVKDIVGGWLGVEASLHR
jgi:hypothetical protein